MLLHSLRPWSVLLVVITLTQHLIGQAINEIRTKDLRLIYFGKSYEYLSPHVVRCFENALRYHRELFHYEPSGEVTVILNDFGDFGNGAAGVNPRNIISVEIAPLNYVYETLPANERMNWVMNHELVHIVSLDQGQASERFFRTMFWGKVPPTAENPISMLYSYLTSPRTFSSRWFREGLAVFIETWMAGGLGRAMGSYDEMKFRTMVRDSALFYDPQGLEAEGTKVDFQVGANAYLYGTRFITYAAYVHGPEKVIQWISRSEGSNAHYAGEYERVFGISMYDDWNNWISFEHTFQRDNLDSIGKYPLTVPRTLSAQGLGSVSRAAYDSKRNVLYAAVNYPGQIPHIASINMATGVIEKLCEVKGAALFDVASLAFDSASSTIFFTTDNNAYRDLHAYSLEAGEEKELIVDGRVGDLVLNRADRSLWGVRHMDGISTIVRIPPPYTEWNQIHSWQYGTDVYDLDISPDGALLSAAMVEVTGRQRLIQLGVNNLMNGNASYDVLYDFQNSNPANFIYSPDGRSLIGTSYYSGVSNVFRYDVQQKKMEALSNCETGFFRVIPYRDDSLIVFAYTGKGFVPSLIPIRPTEDVSAIRFLGNEVVEKYPIVTTWKAPSPARINLDSVVLDKREYRPIDNFGFTSAYPIIEGYKNTVAIGMRFNLSDKIMLHNADLTMSYTPNRAIDSPERIHAAFNYKFWDWTLRANYNGADFYDLFGPTKLSRKGYSLSVQNKHRLLDNDPQSMDLLVRAAGFGGLERLPDAQNIASSYSEMFNLLGKIEYQYFRKSLGAADIEKGLGWNVKLNNNIVTGKIFPLAIIGIDWGVPLAWGHSSVWFHGNAGNSFGDRNDPFGNFYFGGFGNNWIDHQESKRFRDAESFPGMPINSIAGADYMKGMIEWMFPPLRFRSVGLPNFYCSYMQTSLFITTITTNITSGLSNRSLFNIGFQFDFKLYFFSALEATWSLGYAKAFEQGKEISDELMISLKIL